MSLDDTDLVNSDNLNNSKNSYISSLKELYAYALDILNDTSNYSENNKGNTIGVFALSEILNKYVGTDWEQYIIKTPIFSCSYNKNLLFSSEILDLYIITWPPQSSSKIHDHPDNGCIMRVLSGELEEDEYAYICESPVYVATNIINSSGKNIGYKKGKEMLHKIRNNTNDFVISMHFYSKGGYKSVIYN